MAQPEARLQRRIVEALARQGWRAYRLRPMGLAGWPDLYVLVEGRPVHLEVKRPGRRPTRGQQALLAELAAAGATVGVATSPAEALAIARSALEPMP